METLTNNNVPKKHRADWKANHALLEAAIIKYLKEEKRTPTWDELEMETCLSRPTIAAHSKELYMSDATEKSRLYAGLILERQAHNAYATGDGNEAKTFFKLNFDWTEKSETRHSGSVEHTISIEAIKARQQALLNGEAADGEFEEMGDSEPETSTQLKSPETIVSENVINLLQNTAEQFPETANGERE